MKKILIFGMSNSIGGISTFIYNVVCSTRSDRIHYDFIVVRRDKKNNNPYIEEIKKYYDGDVSFYEMTKFKRDPVKALIETWNFYLNKRMYYDEIYMNIAESSALFYIIPFLIRKRIRIVVHSHSSYSPHPLQNILLRPLLNKVADVRMACSEKAGKWLFKNHEFSIVNVGIDTEKFVYSETKRIEIRKKLDIDQQCLLIGNVGRLSSIKNQKFLIEIFLTISDRINNSKLIIIGDGELRSELNKLTEINGLSEKVIFIYKSLEVDKFYSAFDVFVMPSLFEGLPTVGIEAQSEGLPCFFSDTIDPRILITDRSYMVPLTSDASVWTNKIIENIRTSNRAEYAAIMRNKGFDSKDISKEVLKCILNEYD